MKIETVSDFRRAMRYGPYAWPGAYPVYFITADGGVISFEAAKEERRQVVRAIGHDEQHSGWRICAAEVNWEEDLVCDHYGTLIERAYPAE